MLGEECIAALVVTYLHRGIVREPIHFDRQAS